MSIPMVLLPVFVQVALTFVLMYLMAYARTSAISRKEARIRDTALGQPAWPEFPTKVANCYHNQLQLPVLFYALVPLALFTRKADLLFVVMSWLFVLLRIAHAYIHVTRNHVPTRFFVFGAASLVLLLMWIIFAVRILLEIG